MNGGLSTSVTGNAISARDDIIDQEVSQESHNLNGNVAASATGNGVGTIITRDDIIDQDSSQKLHNLNGGISAAAVGNQINSLDVEDDADDFDDHSDSDDGDDSVSNNSGVQIPTAQVGGDGAAAAGNDNEAVNVDIV